jgi:hypothetical protein
MKVKLTECPRYFMKYLENIKIDTTELTDTKGNKIVNCKMCGFSNSKGQCIIKKNLFK